MGHEDNLSVESPYFHDLDRTLHLRDDNSVEVQIHIPGYEIDEIIDFCTDYANMHADDQTISFDSLISRRKVTQLARNPTRQHSVPDITFLNKEEVRELLSIDWEERERVKLYNPRLRALFRNAGLAIVRDNEGHTTLGIDWEYHQKEFSRMSLEMPPEELENEIDKRVVHSVRSLLATYYFAQLSPDTFRHVFREMGRTERTAGLRALLLIITIVATSQEPVIGIGLLTMDIARYTRRWAKLRNISRQLWESVDDAFLTDLREKIRSAVTIHVISAESEQDLGNMGDVL